MKQPINFDSNVLLKTVSESYRNFYSSPTIKVWSSLRNGQKVSLSGQFAESGWCLVFATIDGKEYQLTKKQIRTSDLKFYFGGSNE